MGSSKYLIPMIFICFLCSISHLLATVGVPFIPENHPSFFLIDGILDTIPVKNQASDAAWVEKVNSSYNVFFTHIPKPRASSFKCLSYAASTCVDWWMYQLGVIKSFPAYQSLTHGGIEHGINPRELEAQYYARSKADEPGFFLLPFPGIDSLTHERVPYSLEAYCKVITNPIGADSYEDPALGSAFAVHESKNWYGMDDNYKILFQYNVVGGDKEKTRILQEALKDHGPCYGGIEFSVAFGLSVHIITIVGFGEIDGQTWFVYRESFGDGSVAPYTGEPPYRMCPVGRINEAYAFPHHLSYQFKKAAKGKGYILSIENQLGKAVEPDQLDVKLTGFCPSFSYKREDTGLYRFLCDEPENSTWQLEINFNKMYFAQKSSKPYELKFRFRGQRTVRDRMKSHFNTLFKE
jgi:hypothetical protein